MRSRQRAARCVLGLVWAKHHWGRVGERHHWGRVKQEPPVELCKQAAPGSSCRQFTRPNRILRSREAARAAPSCDRCPGCHGALLGW